jgi:uncharacterized repeat protein (TIGR01451 family)
MSKLCTPKRQRVLYLFSALILGLTTLSPIAVPVYANTGPDTNALSSNSSQALPTWWNASLSSPSRSSQALPAWWLLGGPVAAPRVRPLADPGSLNHFDITVPLTATAGQPFSTTIEAKNGSGGRSYVTATISLSTTNGGTITPDSTPLVSGTWSGDVSLTTADVGRTVKAISGTITGQAAITIYAGDLTTITVAPDPATVTVGTMQQFTATGTDQYSNSVSITPVWNTSVGDIITTTGLFTAPPTPGTGIVTATDGSVSGTATVNVIHGPVHSFHISPSQISTQTAGDSFYLTVEARDVYGNVATRYDGTAILTDSTGSVTPTSIQFAAGVWNEAVSITQASASVCITVTDGVTVQASNAFTVVPAPLHHILIRSAAGGGGNEVGEKDMTIYDTPTFYSAGYDQYENYRQDYSVTWSAGGVLPNDGFSPNPGISTTFTPAPILSGSGTITATHSHVPSDLVDSTGVITVRAPRLIISKDDTPDLVSPGDSLLYTIVYTNVGNASVPSVRITETYDANVNFDFATKTPSEDDNVWFLDGWLDDGDKDGFSVVVKVVDSLDPGTVLTNVVTIGGPRLGQYAFTETTVVTSSPALTLALTANESVINAGENLVYHIDYLNSGDAPVHNVVITMVHDADVSTRTISSDPPLTYTYDAGASTVVWTLGELAGGDDGEIDVTVRVNDLMEDLDTLRTDVKIVSDDTSEDSAFALTTVYAPKLALAKIAAPSPAIAFDRLTYTLVYSNVGHAAASAIRITDAVPANAEYVACQPAGCYENDGTVTWEPGGLGVGASGAVTMVVDVDRNLDSGTVLTNHARVFVINIPDYSATAKITTTVVSSPSLWLSISDGRTSVQADDDVVYTLSYGNVGNGRAYDTTIVATPPSLQHVSYVGCSPDGQCSWDDSQVSYDLGAVEGGESGSVSLNVRVHDPLPAGARIITASAVINTVTPGDLSGDNTAQDMDDIATRPDLQVQAHYYNHTPYPGKRITYTVHYSNTGHIDTTGVVITAAQSTHTTYDSDASSPCWQLAGEGRYTCPVGALGYNEGGSLLFVVTLPTGTFTTTMPNFDAAFGVYDDGGSGDDGNSGNNVKMAPLGVPDVIIKSVEVNWVSLLGHQHGQHVTVTLKNQGGGWACNPIGFTPPECGGFWIDLYINPDPAPLSYPSDDYYGEVAAQSTGILPGMTKDIVFSFALPQDKQPPLFLYVRLDNSGPNPERPYGLVPEYNELNNVFGPVALGYGVYLPVVLSNH